MLLIKWFLFLFRSYMPWNIFYVFIYKIKDLHGIGKMACLKYLFQSYSILSKVSFKNKTETIQYNQGLIWNF